MLEQSQQLPAKLPPAHFTNMLEMDSAQCQGACLLEWAAKNKEYVDHALFQFLGERRTKVSFPIPSSWLLIPPLAIDHATSGANLTAFREPMNFDHLMMSSSQSSQNESASTVWMLDALRDAASQNISVGQMGSAMWIWSEDAFLIVSTGRAGAAAISWNSGIPSIGLRLKDGFS